MGSKIRRMGRVLGGLSALAAGLALACGGEEPTTAGSSMAEPAPTAAPALAEGSAPELEGVALVPESPQPGQSLEARPTLRTTAGPGVRYEYEWSVDGQRQEASSSRFHIEGDVERGSQIEVSVVAFDGDARSAPVSASVRIGNSPPVLHGVVIEPRDRVVAGQSLTAVPKATDPDGDDLEFEYRWDVNGETVVTGEPILPAFHFKRGDKIRLTVSASDGTDSSDEIQSAPIEVVNANPSIVSTPGALDPLGRFTYKLAVEDADGDQAFSYRLTEGPPGMSMDPVDGTVRWEPRPEQTGKFPVKVEVADRQGGTATQSFMMEIGVAEEESASPPAKDAP
jgi:Putative Ig domain